MRLRKGQKLQIAGITGGPGITLTVAGIGRDRVRLAIAAPGEVAAPDFAILGGISLFTAISPLSRGPVQPAGPRFLELQTATE